MIILISGASHTGKTNLAQRLLEEYQYPYLSVDHLKMGLIRSGNTALTPMSDDAALAEYLWPIVREIIKTAVENGQNLIVEGCYIPFDWQSGFDERYLPQIRHICLILSERYIRAHFEDIKNYASVIEQRLDDSDYTMESALRDNAETLEMCKAHHVNYQLIDDEYSIDFEL
ncbi:MAG: adenylate kinase [Acutalibacteraceae bacterium]